MIVSYGAPPADPYFDQMREPPRAPKETLDLAEHHLEILKHRFPDYEYKMGEWPTQRIEIAVFALNDDDDRILLASFSTNRVDIKTRPGLDWTETINYSDPKFTDDMLSDILEGLILDRDIKKPKQPTGIKTLMKTPNRPKEAAREPSAEDVAAHTRLREAFRKAGFIQ